MFDPFELGNGVIVAREAVHLAIDLELAGFQLRAEGDRLHLTAGVTVRDTLSDDQRTSIKTWKTHLLVVVAYCEDTRKRDSESVTPKRDVTKRDARDSLRKLLG